MSKPPKVSVVTITYNHEKYIREALDSFIVQQTNFPFEVIIADDCSTDNTASIVREYAAAYPDIIVPILRKKNIGAQNNARDALRTARGQFIALCEGDDYWTDPQKLQLQADYLDSHTDAALCFHPVRVFYETHEKPDSIFPDTPKKKTFTTTDLLRENFIQTNSVMYRRRDYTHLPVDVLPLDWYMHLYHAQFGKIGYLDRVMAAYRRHPGGLWWEATHDINEIWKKHGLAHLALYVEISKLFNTAPAHRKIVSQYIDDMICRLIAIDEKYGSYSFKNAMVTFPEVVTAFVSRHLEMLQSSKISTIEQEQEIQNLHGIIENQAHQLDELKHELRVVRSSRLWKARNKIARTIGKPEA